MSAIQTNIWTCDICGATATTGGVTMAYVDPLVVPPDGWDVNLEVPLSLHAGPHEDYCDACPQCAAAPNWDKYVERLSMPKYPDSIICYLGRLPRAGDWYVQCCLEDMMLITADDLSWLAGSIAEVGGDVFPTLDAALACAVPDIQKSGQYTQEEIDGMVARHRETERRFAAGEDITRVMNESKPNPYADGTRAFAAGRPRSSPPSYDLPDGEAQWFDGWDDAEREASEAKSAGGRPLDYEDTRRRVVEYLGRSVRQILRHEVYAKILGTSASATKIRISADHAEWGTGLLAAQWLSDLTDSIADGKDVGKLTIEPDGDSTLITVRK